MRQIWIPKIGGPEVLVVRQAPDPEPGQGEICLRVEAAGVNFADILARMGLYPDAPRLPAVVGYECSGLVEKLGAGVQGFCVGDRAMALTRFGAYSDRVVVSASQVLAMPAHLTFEQAAAIPVNYLTAWLMLIRLGHVRSGDRVLIHAVAGGVGQAAMQLCQWRGAQVLGTASASKHERLKALGVTHVIDYHAHDFEKEVQRLTRGEGVDIVLDAVGGKSLRKSYRCLRSPGQLFVFGISSFAPGRKRSLWAALAGLARTPRFSPIPLMHDNRGVYGVNLGHLWHRAELLREMMQGIMRLVAAGNLNPVVDRSFPFAQAGQAHAYIQDRRNFGKVVLVP